MRMFSYIKEIFYNIVGVLSYVIFTLFAILPIYSAIKDLMTDKILWAVLDFTTVIIGIIRGIMYLLGYL
ncbi:hypothetical protein A6A20_04135 [Volucribacter amazonae]|uniref:Uncharacterized protein n=1 Tax=Volucribacter amazonae TaxID=256731 RepID=A0A9X4PAR8_9PAST|nr:hypothetical protein [Volucribacter amazonae]